MAKVTNEMLEEYFSNTKSINEIAKEAGVSRQAVWHRIKTFKNDRIKIEEQKNKENDIE